ncbi:hypothetical protein TI39_contig4127g00002 [Zymoseptoria brevis]|uniref:Uncharacterized protein n=1 Tax=Zymoseptoria brevis TaxID=1047168 RepID=A0A0F4GCU3_9PEZI|nr:hypothetical protein TI39_contig4127g00002 [Zymoseptoria brevis]
MATKSIRTTKEWEELVAGILLLRQVLSQPFESTKAYSKTAQDLTSSIEEVLQTPDRVTFALVGQSSSGRSATINSLLAVGDIARDGDDFGATTLTNQSFSGKLPGQRAPFLAEVSFVSRNDRWEILAGFVRDCYRNDSKKPVMIRALRSLFNDWPSCTDDEAVASLLAEAEAEDDVSIVAELMQYGDDLMEGKQSVVFSAPKPAELLEQLELYDCRPLTNDDISFLEPPAGAPHYTRELNDLRYLRDATHAIIATTVGRAIQDPAVYSHIRTMRQLGTNRLIAIVTQSGMLNDGPVQHNQRPKDRARQLQNQLADVRTEQKSLDKDLTAVPEPSPEYTTMTQRRREPMKLERAAFVEEKALRFHLRRKAVEGELKINPVPTLSISNGGHKKPAAGLPPTVFDGLYSSLEGTNIPALRRQITAFANEFRCNKMQQLVDVTIPALFDRLGVFASDEASHDEDTEHGEQNLREDLVGSLPKARRTLDGPMRNALAALGDESTSKR